MASASHQSSHSRPPPPPPPTLGRTSSTDATGSIPGQQHSSSPHPSVSNHSPALTSPATGYNSLDGTGGGGHTEHGYTSHYPVDQHGHQPYRQPDTAGPIGSKKPPPPPVLGAPHPSLAPLKNDIKLSGSPAPMGLADIPDSTAPNRDGATTCSTGPDGAAIKKRKTGPGSRGVANLTPEQLAKKRANGKPIICFVLYVGSGINHNGLWASLVHSFASMLLLSPASFATYGCKLLS